MTQNNKKHTQDKWGLKFDPIVLVRDVAKRWLLILLVVLIVGMAAYMYADMSYRPAYQTSITYVTYSRDSGATVYLNLSAATTVASVFEELLNSSLLHKTIMEEGDIAAFGGTIQAQVIPSTNLLTVTVSGTDPREVFQMAQALVDHHETVTYLVVDNVSLELLRNPTVPVAPSNSANAMGLAKKAASLAAVAMIALLGYLSFIRDTVRSGREAQAKLDCSYLGEIPHEKKYKTIKAMLRRKKTAVLVTNPVASFRYVEMMRKLASRVEYHMHGKKVVMVTSHLENEGKTTVAANLALSMARKHERVLLIDCDLRKPACYKIMEQNRLHNGLCDVLSGKISVNQGLIRDKKSGLYMLLESKPSRITEKYLGGENMQLLLQWARENFDMVILDLPPLAMVSDAESMKELADCSLLVVRQSKPKTAAINKAIAMLSDGRATLLGCVLNDVYSTGLVSGSYGYGYGYRYGRYGHYGKYGHYGHYNQYRADENND